MEIQDLRRVVARGERLPGGIGDATIGVEFVHGTKQKGFKWIPTGRIRSGGDPPEIFVAQPHHFADGHMMAPFVFRPAQPPHEQDNDFPLARRKRRFPQDVGCEYEPSLQKLGVPRQSREDVEGAAIADEGFQSFPGFLVNAHRFQNDCG